MWLIFALILIPLVEIALFIELGGALGLWPTLGLILLTAVLGAGLMRSQGVGVLQKLQSAAERGEDLKGPLAEGAMILLAGMLMLTPGFFTDLLGLTMLIPPVRRATIGWAGPRLAARRADRRPASERADRRPASERGEQGRIIVADYKEVETETRPEPAAESGWTRPPGPERR